MQMAFGSGLLPKLILPIAVLASFFNYFSAFARESAQSQFEVLRYDLAANQDVPELCFMFTESLARQLAVPLESFVSVEPAATFLATPRKDQLCLTGFVFGRAYAVTLKSGLPGVSGVLPKDAQFRIEVPNRPPEFGFATPDGTLLPRIGNLGLPIRTVNVGKLDIQIFRIADDDILAARIRRPLSTAEQMSFAPERGERVWTGTLEINGEPNTDTVTQVSVEKTIGALKPGLYIATLAVPAMPMAGQSLPTQYFTISDLGLSVFRGPTSLLVAARTLSTAAVAAGVDIALIAANNRELARVRTDGNGFARFEADALRGTGGSRPAAIFAYGMAGEFALIEFGDDGAPMARRPIEVLIHADRPAYQPGEVVNILMLARSDQGIALTKLPLVVDVIQPNGAPFTSRNVSDLGAGAYNFSFILPNSGVDGRWKVEARPDPGGSSIGSTSIEVSHPSTSRLNLSLNAGVAVIDPTQPVNIAIQAQYPDGQAANIPGDLYVRVAAAPVPFPAFAGFSFGLDDEAVEAPMPDPIHFVSDSTGKANISVKVAASIRSTRPLEAHITARLRDVDGAIVDRTAIIPVATQSLLLGVKPPAIPSGDRISHFEIIAVNPDGAQQDIGSVGWEILRQDPVPAWHWDGQRFAYRPTFKDSHIVGGLVDIPVGAPATLEAPLPSGRYRIEVFDPKGESLSSARFTVGWVARNQGDPPDIVTLTSQRPNLTAGGPTDIFVQPPFDADVSLTSADPQIRETIVQHVPATGATLKLPIPREAGLAVQLLAQAVAPADPSAPGLARRAYGQATLLPDPAIRGLDVKLDLPVTAPPQGMLSVPVTVTGGGDETVYVRVSAINERLEADSQDRIFPFDSGIIVQRTTAAALDNYGEIITPSGLTNSSSRAADVKLSARRSTWEARKPGTAPFGLYSGIVALDKAGKGNVLFALPDFAGRLMVKAIAWTASRSGEGEAELAVRYPLDTEIPLPSYLTPDDRADFLLHLDNADGPRGEYRISVKCEGAITLLGDGDAVLNLAEHEQRNQPVTVQAHGPGEGTIVLTVNGPGGIAFERHLPLPVRLATPNIARHATSILRPGGALALEQGLTNGLRPETVNMSIFSSAGSDFDLPAIANELAAKKRDSAELIVDAAAPLLGLPPISERSGPGQRAAADLSQIAQSLAPFQGADGGFSLFGSEPSDPWLTAYVVDFLTSAQNRGASVPDVIRRRAMDYLALCLNPRPDADPPPPDHFQCGFAAAAYAARVLAANDRLSLFQLRYFYDRNQSQLRSPIVTALVAASFASLGDKAAASAAFARAGSLPSEPILAELFGSDLRNQAMLTTLMGESGAVAQPIVTANLVKTEAIAAAHRQFSPQEAAWILRASATQPANAAAIKLKVGDKTVSQSSPYIMTSSGPLLAAIKNSGDAPLHLSVTVTGSPNSPESKDQAGYEVQRWFFDTSGKAIDPAALRQGEMAVVVLTGRFTGQGEAHPLISESLPAGWVAEAGEIVDPIGRYPWLKDLSGASHVDIKDGRYVAVPRLTGDRREFKLAYVVRAAVRGQYNLPGTVVDDMAQPSLSTHDVGGRTRVDPPS